MEYKEIAEKIDIELLKRYPRDSLKGNRLLPVQRQDGYILFYSDEIVPLPVLDELEVYGNIPIKIKQLSEGLFNRLINEYLEAPLDTVEAMIGDFDTISTDDFSNIELDEQVENLEELAQEAPIIKLVNAIITTALKKGVSDIHIEPFEEKIRLRYRIDGVLYENPAPPKKLYPAIKTRIKIMSKLNIAERRLPQEGRIRIRVLGRELDIRVSFIPTLYGESIVLRLLDRAEYLLDLNNLGLDEVILQKYKEIISFAHGIVLVTGPTGSGKTTTLYATLEYLNSPGKKIITIEDPVEYQLDGINQIQVKQEIDFSFARGLRSILRQDPDIVMIGEIRDVETARIAIQAALTGHLVFATLHTNDSAGAVVRLLDMGIEDYLLAATIKGIMAQRLVRALCPACKKRIQPEEEQLLGLPDLKYYRAGGCEECNEMGFKGRQGIYELLPVNTDIKEMISGGCKADQIQKKAAALGIKTLYQAGLERVNNGITTYDEVIRVTRN